MTLNEYIFEITESEAFNKLSEKEALKFLKTQIDKYGK